MRESATLTVAELNRLVTGIFVRAGMSGLQAESVARVIVAAERDACSSHGLYRIEGTLRTIAAGKVRADAVPKIVETGRDAIVRVNAAGGFANPAFDLGLPILADRARKLGMAALVINDCTHFSALWSEVEGVTREGLACMAMCPSYATVAPAGGSRALLGTNPYAFGWPRPDQDPYVFDFATSVAARGEIELRRRAGQILPEGWAVDAMGQPTVEPEQALGGAMLPFGGHKGSAISTMIELLAAIMIGDLTSKESLDKLGSTTLAPPHGELVLAFSPEAFADGRPGSPFDRAETLFAAILAQGARLPSQRRFEARRRAERNGVTLGPNEIALLGRLGAIAPGA